MAKAIATDDQLNADSSCDVCGQDNGSVRPRVTPFGAALVHFFTGRCCDELFDYGTPDTRTATFRRLARNEPCPCRSGRKFKHCCATVAAP